MGIPNFGGRRFKPSKLRRKHKAEKRARHELMGKKSQMLGQFIKKFPLVKAIPSHPEQIEARIRAALAKNQKLRIIVFWGGAKEGPESAAGNAEAVALDKLAWFAHELGIYGVKFDVRLLFMDSYARRLNNEPEEKIALYRESLKGLLAQHGFGLDSLERLYMKLGSPESERESPSGRKWKESAQRTFERISAEPEVMSMISALARKHSPNPNIGEVIRDYVYLHAYDDYLLERAFPGAIYVSFGNQKTQKAISDLPTIFVYRNKEKGKPGELGVPWFSRH